MAVFNENTFEIKYYNDTITVQRSERNRNDFELRINDKLIDTSNGLHKLAVFLKGKLSDDEDIFVALRVDYLEIIIDVLVGKFDILKHDVANFMPNVTKYTTKYDTMLINVYDTPSLKLLSVNDKIISEQLISSSITTRLNGVFDNKQIVVYNYGVTPSFVSNVVIGSITIISDTV